MHGLHGENSAHKGESEGGEDVRCREVYKTVGYVGCTDSPLGHVPGGTAEIFHRSAPTAASVKAWERIENFKSVEQCHFLDGLASHLTPIFAVPIPVRKTVFEPVVPHLGLQTDSAGQRSSGTGEEPRGGAGRSPLRGLGARRCTSFASETECTFHSAEEFCGDGRVVGPKQAALASSTWHCSPRGCTTWRE